MGDRLGKEERNKGRIDGKGRKIRRGVGKEKERRKKGKE